MKLRVVFIEPPYETEKYLKRDDAKIVFIKDPYKITMIDGGRNIVDVTEHSIKHG